MNESEKDPAMKEDYLWDGSGEPDREVQKLENLLGRYRHNQPAPSFESVSDSVPAKRRWSFLSFSFSFQLAAVGAMATRQHRSTPGHG